MGRIPGRMRKRIWIRRDDVVLATPWVWQDENVVELRYSDVSLP